MSDKRILMGVVGRPHGVRGLVRLANHASSDEVLAAHALTDDRGRVWRVLWRGAGVAALADATGRVVSDRDEAASLTNMRLHVERSALPPAGEDEFYLADLVGLDAVATGTMAPLGRVLAVHDYGAGASLEISGLESGSIMVPFTRAAVPVVDVAANRIEVAILDEIEVSDERALAAASPALSEHAS